MFKKFFAWIKSIIDLISSKAHNVHATHQVRREEKRKLREERRIQEEARRAAEAKAEAERRKKREAELERLRIEHEARVAAEQAAYQAKLKTPTGLKEETSKLLDTEISNLNNISHEIDYTSSRLRWLYYDLNSDENASNDIDALRIKLMNIRSDLDTNKSKIDKRIDKLHTIKDYVSKITELDPQPTN